MLILMLLPFVRLCEELLLLLWHSKKNFPHKLDVIEVEWVAIKCGCGWKEKRAFFFFVRTSSVFQSSSKSYTSTMMTMMRKNVLVK